MVAQEVGNLASMSGKAAEEIFRLIHETTTLARDSESINNEARKTVSTKMENTFESLKVLAAKVNVILTHVTEISTVAREQASSIEVVSSAVQTISQGTIETAQLAMQNTERSEALGTLAALLTELASNLELVIQGKPHSSGEPHDFTRRESPVSSFRQAA